MSAIDAAAWLAERPALAERLHPREVSSVVAPTDVDALREAITAPGAWAIGAGTHARPASAAPEGDGLTLVSTAALDHVHDIQRRSGVVKVDAGIRVEALELALNAAALTMRHLGPLPADATWGGLLSRAWPLNPVMHTPSVRNACVGLEAITRAGERFTYTPAPRKSSGPDLRGFFLGAEGRAGVISTLWLAAADRPEHVIGLIARADAPGDLVEVLRDALRAGLRPRHTVIIADADGPRLGVELAGHPSLVDLDAQTLRDACVGHGVALTMRDDLRALELGDLDAVIRDPIDASLRHARVVFSGQGDWPTIEAAVATASEACALVVTRAHLYGAHLVALADSADSADSAEAAASLRDCAWRWSRPRSGAAQNTSSAWLARWRGASRLEAS